MTAAEVSLRYLGRLCPPLPRRRLPRLFRGRAFQAPIPTNACHHQPPQANQPTNIRGIQQSLRCSGVWLARTKLAFTRPLGATVPSPLRSRREAGEYAVGWVGAGFEACSSGERHALTRHLARRRDCPCEELGPSDPPAVLPVIKAIFSGGKCCWRG